MAGNDERLTSGPVRAGRADPVSAQRGWSDRARSRMGRRRLAQQPQRSRRRSPTRSPRGARRIAPTLHTSALSLALIPAPQGRGTAPARQRRHRTDAASSPTPPEVAPTARRWTPPTTCLTTWFRNISPTYLPRTGCVRWYKSTQTNIFIVTTKSSVRRLLRTRLRSSGAVEAAEASHAAQLRRPPA